MYTVSLIIATIASLVITVSLVAKTKTYVSIAFKLWIVEYVLIYMPNESVDSEKNYRREL